MLDNANDPDNIHSVIIRLEERFLDLETRMESTVKEVKGSLDNLTLTVQTSMSQLIEALTGVDRIPTPVMTKIVTILGVVILGLLIALVYALTGLKLGVLPSSPL